MIPRIPLTQPQLGEREWLALREVIESGWITQGPKVAEFEAAMAALCDARHAVAVSSCTAALHLALICSGVTHGDEVIVPSMSYIATANAVVHAGAKPIFAEIDPRTFNLDLADVRTRITSKTKAIILVHQLGLAADIEGFRALARDCDLRLIEDAACAIGSRYRGRPIGSHSDLVCFSFHPRKIVSTGDGGMVLTSSDAHATRLRLLRQQGMSIADRVRHTATVVVREIYAEVGYNYRMTDLQAAIGIEQLKRLPEILADRRRLRWHYDAAFAGDEIIEAPDVPPHVEWNVQSYAVRLRGFDAGRRDRVMQRMLDAGIATRAGVMTAHREPAYRSHGRISLPISEAASDGSLQLPLYSSLSSDQQDEVIALLRAAVGELSARR